MTIVYGIPNCSSVKKARAWLDAQGIAYQFHDFKKQGIDGARLTRWIDACGMERVLNRKGTTWRALSDSQRAGADTPSGAIALMQAHPSLIKRPVIEQAEHTVLGYDEARYGEVFGQ
ncbi:MAG: ArsC family reductase [Paludibacterium sp.]|uniref:ArsC family reductase n=1 Tax=Paludibacterium sp. TaxID=1917523 RepID=UPI0025E59A4C|nr:ArsC family reductase [Paludibacterium sp.]MBV8046729.1 ArsC family reductase [Paludibacterium sp.]MBV8649796.1 ArsC family reductase [Paludibacterium sp.]